MAEWKHDAAVTTNLYTARLIGQNRPMRRLRWPGAKHFRPFATTGP